LRERITPAQKRVEGGEIVVSREFRVLAARRLVIRSGGEVAAIYRKTEGILNESRRRRFEGSHGSGVFEEERCKSEEQDPISKPMMKRYRCHGASSVPQVAVSPEDLPMP